MELPADLPVLCAEIVSFEAEYRIYLVNGDIKAICQYKGRKREMAVDVVEPIVSTLWQNHKELVGCGVDVGLIEKDDKLVPCLIEVNDGYSLCKYDGISGRDYTELLIQRW